MTLRSYIAASTLPVKLLQNIDIIRSIRSEIIPPVHIQLNPTNRCNLNCGFCSCSERDRKAELSLEQIIDVMTKFKSLGCRSVTITGGGEPLLHSHINSILSSLNIDLKIKIGLVTNGTQFKHLSNYLDITWCRISSSDDREPDWDGITKAVEQGPQIDWAFSHVLTSDPDWSRLCRLVRFANKHNFTHVRIVGDLLDIELSATQVRQARNHLYVQGIEDSKVIYQDRAEYVKGRNKCGISLLKPVVGADGGIYPCCGVQYAQDPPGRDLIKSMRMGSLEDIDKIWKIQQSFDGSVCSRCYYDNYNSALDLLSTPLCHEEFI
jgi:organic radical activating enzyme